MTQRRAIQIVASLQVQSSRTFQRIGCAPSAVLEKMTLVR